MKTALESRDKSIPLYFLNEEIAVHCLLFMQSGKHEYLMCGREDGSVTMWDLQTLRKKESFLIHIGSSQCLSMNMCDNKLYTQDKTGVVKCWLKSESWTELRSLKVEYCGFCKLSFESDLQLIACPFNNSSVQIYNLEFKYVTTLKPEGTEKKIGYIMATKFVKRESELFLLGGYEDGSIVLWNVDSNSMICLLNVYKSPIFALDFDVSNNHGVCSSNSKKIYIFKLSESLSLECNHVIKMKCSGDGCVKLNPLRKILAVGCQDKAIRIFSWISYKLLSTFPFHSLSINDLCFSPKYCEVFDSECLLYASSQDKKISLWNVAPFSVR